MCSFFQFDAKKSPLALLAQTCNSIGKDMTPGRPLLRTSSSFLSSKDPAGKDGARSGGAKDCPPKTKDQPTAVATAEDGEEDSGKTTVSLDASPEEADRSANRTPGCTGGIISSASAATTSSGKSFTAGSAQANITGDHHGHSSGQRKSSSKDKTVSSGSAHRVRSNFTPKRDSKDGDENSTANPAKGTRFCAPESEVGNLSRQSKTTALHQRASPVGTGDQFAHLSLKTGSSSPLKGDCLSPLSSGYLSSGPPYFAPQQLLCSVDSLSKLHSLSSLSSYLSYLQSRGGDSSPCKDPFCTECPPPLPHLPFLSMGGLIEKCLSSTPSSHLGLHRPPYGLAPQERGCSQGPVTLDALSALYSGSLVGSPLFSPTVPPSPWVCPWVSVEGEYCAKRCSSAEELLVHSRSHWPSARITTPTSHTASPAGLYSLPSFMGYSPYYPFGSGIGSMSFLRQAYGSRSAPHGAGLLALGSSSSRFHPYKSPSLSRGLSSHSSSFELYPNQRTMGAAGP